MRSFFLCCILLFFFAQISPVVYGKESLLNLPGILDKQRIPLTSSSNQFIDNQDSTPKPSESMFETRNSEEKCLIWFAFFLDPYGSISEFLFLGGEVKLPCLCPRTTCRNVSNIQLGTMQSDPTTQEPPNFQPLPYSLRPTVSLSNYNLTAPYFLKLFRFSISTNLTTFLSVPQNRTWTCTCGSHADRRQIHFPYYRICTEAECRDSCSETDAPGDQPNHSSSSICLAEFNGPPISINCLNHIGKAESCSLEHHGGDDFCCPSGAHYSVFESAVEQCLDDRDKYWDRGLCRAYNASLMDRVTWEGVVAFVMPHIFHSSQWINDIFNRSGLLSRKTKSCSRDIGSEVKLGTVSIRARQTYQLNQTSTPLTLSSVSTCFKHRPIMTAYFCLDQACRNMEPLDGDCVSGWEVSLKNFTHFRHQIYITDASPVLRLPQKLTKYMTTAGKVLFRQIGHERNYLSFFVIPQKILMKSRTVGNTLQTVCLLPDGEKETTNDSCDMIPEIQYQTCFPKVQRFIINRKIEATSSKTASPPTTTPSTKTDKPQPFHWWKILLIVLGSVFAVGLVIVALILCYRKKRAKSSSMLTVACYALPEGEISVENSVIEEMKRHQAESEETTSDIPSGPIKKEKGSEPSLKSIQLSTTQYSTDENTQLTQEDTSSTHPTPDSTQGVYYD